VVPSSFKSLERLVLRNEEQEPLGMDYLYDENKKRTERNRETARNKKKRLTLSRFIGPFSSRLQVRVFASFC